MLASLKLLVIRTRDTVDVANTKNRTVIKIYSTNLRVDGRVFPSIDVESRENLLMMLEIVELVEVCELRSINFSCTSSTEPLFSVVKRMSSSLSPLPT